MKKNRYSLFVCIIGIVFILVVIKSVSAQQVIPALIKKVQPAVVLIIAYDTIGNTSSQGSGFFVSQKGEIVTNWHVIRNTTRAIVKTATGAIFEVKGVISKDEKRDIVKLAINSQDISFPYLRLSNILPDVGEQIFVLGNPEGLEATVSDGLVSAIRDITDIGNIIQISAPISHGSSGGPVININGDVIGIASFTLEEGQNLNFAYSAKDISRLSKSTSQTITPLSLSDSYESRVEAAKRYAQIIMPPIVDAEISELSKNNKKGVDLKQLRDWINVNGMKKMIELLVKHYTVEELNAIADFYDTPMGKSILEKYGTVTSDVQGYIQGDMIKELREAKILTSALSNSNQEAEEQFNFGVVYYGQGKYQEAVDAYKQAIRINPDYAEAHINLGLTYLSLGKYQEAVDACKQAIRINSDFVEAYYNLGLAYLNLGRYQEAIDANKQAIRINPDFAEAHYNLGLTYFNLGRQQEAVDAFKEAIRINPDFIDAHVNLGVAYLNLGKYQVAVDAYKQAIKINSDYALAHYNLGIAYTKLDNKSSALEEYMILKEMDKELADELIKEIYK